MTSSSPEGMYPFYEYLQASAQLAALEELLNVLRTTLGSMRGDRRPVSKRRLIAPTSRLKPLLPSPQIKDLPKRSQQ